MNTTKRSKLSVSIVIPNYNGRQIMEKNLPFVLKAAEQKRNNIQEIVVVDDGSKDDSVGFLKTNYGAKIKLIKHTKNRGFSAAVNTGVRAVSGDLVVLLNTDAIPSDDFMISVIRLFEKDQKVFGVSFHESGYGYAKGGFGTGFIEIPPGKEQKGIYKSFFVSGGSGAFRKTIWREIGGMDENLFTPFYWEDVDLSFRAAKRGYINLWISEAKVTHVHESTIVKLPNRYVRRIRERNQLLFIWKNIHSRKLFKRHLVELLRRGLRHPGYLRIVLMAITKLPKVIRARRKEVKESIVSDEAVFSEFK